MSKIICIDAGHGGKDSGAVCGNRYEKNDNLRFALALGIVLTRCGFTVFQTRTSDVTMSLQARTNFANRVKADYFISIHRNSFWNPLAYGVENWVQKGTDSKTIAYATAIQNEVVKVGVQCNRGVKKGNFHVCRETTMPACLLELGFIKNVKDNALYDSNFNKYVEAVAFGICKSAGVAYMESEQTKPPVPTKWGIDITSFCGVPFTEVKANEFVNVFWDNECKKGNYCRALQSGAKWHVEMQAYKSKEDAEARANALRVLGWGVVVWCK